MPVRRLPLLALLALAAALIGAAPAAADGYVQLDGTVLRYTGDGIEPSNVTISDQLGVLRLEENASRMTAGPGCSVSADGYLVECPELGVERIEVQLGDVGSDVRILAPLPADIRGGAGDDLLIGGPAEDTIDGGGGQDVIGGGPGADELHGGPGDDLVTYQDRIGPDGELLGRRTGVRAMVGRLDWSGGFDERDTISTDVEQVEGGDGADRFSLRDGLRTSVACGGGRDRVDADPRDSVDVDCESGTVAPQRGGARLTIPTLTFPFTSSGDRGRGEVRVLPLLPLRGGAVLLRVSCPLGVGLLDLDGPGCSGRVRFARGNVSMGIQRVRVARGQVRTLRLPLSSSRNLARRAGGPRDHRHRAARSRRGAARAALHRSRVGGEGVHSLHGTRDLRAQIGHGSVTGGSIGSRP